MGFLADLVKVIDRDFVAEDDFGNINQALEALGIEKQVINHFIDNHISSSADFDIRQREILQSVAFKADENDHNLVYLDYDKLLGDSNLFKSFMDSVENIVFSKYLPDLEYRKAGLQAFYWEMEKVESGKEKVVGRSWREYLTSRDKGPSVSFSVRV